MHKRHGSEGRRVLGHCEDMRRLVGGLLREHRTPSTTWANVRSLLVVDVTKINLKGILRAVRTFVNINYIFYV
jgi:hypothetical protein